MIRRSLEVIVSRRSDGTVVLTSPALGIYGDPPRTGEGLVAGSVVGTLVIVGRTVDLLVPEGGAGTVAEVHVHDRKTSVAFAQPLVSLSQPLASVAHESKPGARGSRAKAMSSKGSPSKDQGAPIKSATSQTVSGPGPLQSGREDDLPPGAFALRAPTTGVFYARPDPDSEPFVTQGSTLETGQTAGLIEVMKCFSPIVHPGGALPSPVVIERMRVREGEEVRPGQILFVLRRP